jgi:hypothetical protein
MYIPGGELSVGFSAETMTAWALSSSRRERGTFPLFAARTAISPWLSGATVGAWTGAWTGA